MKFLSYAICAFSILSFVSCKDDKKGTPSPTIPTTGSVTMKFDNYVGDSPMELNKSTYYKTSQGYDFKVTRYEYYISNIVLKGENSIVYVEPESYHLINQEDPGSLSFVIDKVPMGDYTSVQIMIGVDSARNVSGAQSGALDPALGMSWNWNSGYIMAKFEGTSPQVQGSSLSYHIAGFSGANSVIKTVELPFGKKMTVTEAAANKITIKSDLMEWFKSPVVIDFTLLRSIGSTGIDAAAIATNYADMFTITAVQ
jgi:hypothetical protein